MSKITRQIITTNNAVRYDLPFNQAIVANGFVYLSGCIGCDKDTMQLVSGGAVPETTKALEHVTAVLEAAGSGLDRVVKATVFIQDMADFANINEVYKKFFPNNYPARTCVQVARLPMNAKVEIEVVALTGDVETKSKL
ncbi:rutC family protein UK114-like [Bradysia coprophila]|uniref:rutC family protein UK114-like n=1 Tax=Bradysia coprophila TaxID=38358 RepID=UPI00187DB3BB|nr:rutC family protein UK114-like [Bradysia coprophila]